MTGVQTCALPISGYTLQFEGGAADGAGTGGFVIEIGGISPGGTGGGVSQIGGSGGLVGGAVFAQSGPGIAGARGGNVGFVATQVGGNISFSTPTDGMISFVTPPIPPVYTVATLPAPVNGMRAAVSDALAPTFLQPVVGGGTVYCPVVYNGSAWVCG